MPNYQTLLDSDRITFTSPVALNLANLLPDPDFGLPTHDCQQILAEDQRQQKDLLDQPLPDAEATWFNNGSSYLAEGQCKAGATIVNGCRVV